MLDKDFMCLRCDKAGDCAKSKLMCTNYFFSIAGNVGNRRKNRDLDHIPDHDTYLMAKAKGLA